MSGLQLDTLKTEIAERVPELVALRRDLHQHPELAFEELRTSNIVAQRLRALDLEVRTGIAQTGVVALLRGEQNAGSTRTIALRADMDALPIHEQNEIPYRSLVDGKMHACGHDGHTAILLTVAELLSRRRSTLRGNVKFIFQPAEESIGGARPMVEQGVMQGVDAVIGLHLISNQPVGRVGVRAGSVFASADSFTVTVQGKGGHAAMPNQAVDPIVISAHIITALQTLISRETSPFSPAVITIASLHAGTTFNVIPEQAVLQGTMRAYTPAHRAYLQRRITEVVHGIATALGGSCTLDFGEGCPPCINDPTTTELIHRAASATVGEDKLDTGPEVQISGSDDMSFFLQAAPGCYFIVGAHNKEKGAQYPHHHPRFNIDEDSLPIAAEVLTRATLDFVGSVS